MFTVASVQMKFRKTIEENVEWIAKTILETARNGADAVLFPECAVTGYNYPFDTLSASQLDEALRRLSRIVKQARCNALIGSPTFEGKRLHNSLLVFNRKGKEIFRYSKIHLTPDDKHFFTPGNKLAFFHLDLIPCTAVICHERRYPELVRIPVMMGAQILFHPNAGMDSLTVSKAKRKGRDGIAVRAFENAIFYVFSNSVGPQGNSKWSAGDSKIVAPDSTVLALANNRDETVIRADLDLTKATRIYAKEALQLPEFLRSHWQTMLEACRRKLSEL